jgi:protein involved in plasmid replication-relaxation
MRMFTARAAAAMMRLTPRDRGLVQVLQELRYLTAAQVQQVCYPSISVRSTSRRLSLLRRRGVLECLSHRTFDDHRAFWRLASLGRAAAGALSGCHPAPPSALAVAAVQMDHLIATNQIFCRLCAEYRAGRLAPFHWLGSHHARVDLGHTHLVPDGVILIAAEDQWWMYCVELDRGTMARDALAVKCGRYRLMRRMAALRRDDPVWDARAEAWVLFVCEDDRRAADIARLAAAHGLDRVWAGTAAACAPGLSAVVGPGACSAHAPLLPGLTGGITPPEVPETPPATAEEGWP